MYLFNMLPDAHEAKPQYAFHILSSILFFNFINLLIKLKTFLKNVPFFVLQNIFLPF